MRNIVFGLLAAMFAMLVLSACGSTSSNSAPTIKHHDRVTSEHLNDYYYIDRIVMDNGLTLVCIEAYQYDDGGPTMSCNWPQFNKDSGR